jgi:hypothetical protein
LCTNIFEWREGNAGRKKCGSKKNILVSAKRFSKVETIPELMKARIVSYRIDYTHLPMASWIKTTPFGRGACGYVAALTCFSLFSRRTAGQQSHGLWPWFFTPQFIKYESLPSADQIGMHIAFLTSLFFHTIIKGCEL